MNIILKTIMAGFFAQIFLVGCNTRETVSNTEPIIAPNVIVDANCTLETTSVQNACSVSNPAIDCDFFEPLDPTYEWSLGTFRCEYSGDTPDYCSCSIITSTNQLQGTIGIIGAQANPVSVFCEALGVRVVCD